MIVPYTRLYKIRTAFGISLFLISICDPVLAQIAFTDKADIKAETKRSRQDAAQIESDYKESHLNTADFTYKKGQPGRKQVKAQEQRGRNRFDAYGNVINSAPVQFSFKRKARRNANN